MRLRSLLALAFVLALVASPAAAGARRAVVVAEDPAGDWAADLAAPASPAGDALGQDLTSASIGREPGGAIAFTLSATALSDTSLRSGVYTWDFRVDGHWWRLTNFVCDGAQYVSENTPPVAAPESCVPTADEGETFEVLECGVERLVNTFANCATRSTVTAEVDTAAGRVTVAVPAKLVGAHRGSVISPAELPGGDISARPATPHGGAAPHPADAMEWTKPYTVR